MSSSNPAWWQLCGNCEKLPRCVLAQVRGYQRDIGILSQQLSDIKHKFFQQKRKDRAEQQLALQAQESQRLDEGELEIKAVRLAAVS